MRPYAIACDYCGKSLPDRAEMTTGSGWNFIWTEREIGSASLAWVTCAECCDIEHSRGETNVAIVRRAERHSPAWGRAVMRYLST